jgi:lycopene cyclase domain-containing protein
MKFEYLLFDALILIGSSWAAAGYKTAKMPHFRSAISAISLLGIPFIGMDLLVTNRFWSFNPQYVMGWKVGELPIEEVLFFLAVPWACLVLWVNMKDRFPSTVNLSQLGWFIKLSLFVLSGWGFWSQSWYTFLVSVVALFFCLLINWRKVAQAYLIFGGVTLFLTAIFNMYLTARPVVTYNAAMITQLRFGTIPIEDFIYGLILVLGVVVSYERVTKTD